MKKKRQINPPESPFDKGGAKSPLLWVEPKLPPFVKGE
jgi:hypothetical protein